MRLCANVPAQHAIQIALGGCQSINELILPGGRLREQRDAAVAGLRAIPGVTCVEPQGALYVFPRLDPDVYPIKDDQEFVLRVPARTARPGRAGHRVQLVEPDHLRIVTLPHADVLTEAVGRLGEFLSTYDGDCLTRAPRAPAP